MHDEDFHQQDEPPPPSSTAAAAGSGQQSQQPLAPDNEAEWEASVANDRRSAVSFDQAFK
jgi:hypothetical protein